MTDKLKPFDRREAFEIFLSWLPNGIPLESAIEASIRDAQAFNEAVENATPKTASIGDCVALLKFGEFVPSGTRLYFCTCDGDRFLVAEFASYRCAVQVAIIFNDFLPTGDRPNAAALTLVDFQTLKNITVMGDK